MGVRLKKLLKNQNRFVIIDDNRCLNSLHQVKICEFALKQEVFEIK